MCLFGGGGTSVQTPTPPVLPPETAAMKEPDAAAVKSATARRTGDRIRSGAQTILTSGSGVKSRAQTSKTTLTGDEDDEARKKTLLGE